MLFFSKKILILVVSLMVSFAHALDNRSIIIATCGTTGCLYSLNTAYGEYKRKKKYQKDTTTFTDFLLSNESTFKRDIGLYSIATMLGMWGFNSIDKSVERIDNKGSHVDEVVDPKITIVDPVVQEDTPKESLIPGAVVLSESQKRVRATLLNAAIGDALGRVTEFRKDARPDVLSITTLDQALDQKYGYAPYTDDTLLALIVFDECRKNGSDDEILDRIARRFVELFGSTYLQVDPLYHVRAHGTGVSGSCKYLSCILSKKGVNHSHKWWRQRYDELSVALRRSGAGCGTVMRAWPIGLVFTDVERIISLAYDQSLITHGHHMAHITSAAIAAGVYYARQGTMTYNQVIEAMIKVAERWDEEEKEYKPGAQKIIDEKDLTTDLLKQSKLLTSDILRLAYKQAKEGKQPIEVLGTHDREMNYRSTDGFYRGWCADEALAAAVYLFARHKGKDIGTALPEAVNTPGDSDSIACLTGALIGAFSGEVYNDDLAKLENSKAIEQRVYDML